MFHFLLVLYSCLKSILCFYSYNGNLFTQSLTVEDKRVKVKRASPEKRLLETHVRIDTQPAVVVSEPVIGESFCESQTQINK